MELSGIWFDDRFFCITQDHCATLLLNVMARWQNYVQTKGKTHFHLSANQLVKELRGIYGKTKVEEAIKLLKEVLGKDIFSSQIKPGGMLLRITHYSLNLTGLKALMTSLGMSPNFAFESQAPKIRKMLNPSTPQKQATEDSKIGQPSVEKAPNEQEALPEAIKETTQVAPVFVADAPPAPLCSPTVPAIVSSSDSFKKFKELFPKKVEQPLVDQFQEWLRSVPAQLEVMVAQMSRMTMEGKLITAPLQYLSASLKPYIKALGSEAKPAARREDFPSGATLGVEGIVDKSLPAGFEEGSIWESPKGKIYEVLQIGPIWISLEELGTLERISVHRNKLLI